MEFELTEGEVAIAKAWHDQNFALEVDVEKGIPGDLKTAIKAVVPWLRSVTSKAESEAVKMAMSKVSAFLASTVSGKVPASAKEKAAPPKTEEKKDDAKPEEKAAKKEAAVDLGAGIDLSIGEDGTIVVRKRKGFTEGRTQALAEATEKMLSMLGDVDQAAFKALMSKMQGGGELPGKDAAPLAQGIHPQGAGNPSLSVAKDSKDSEIVASLREVTKTLGELAKQQAEVAKAQVEQGAKLTAIEKTREPSSSLGNDGTDGKKTKPVEKSFWSNVTGMG